MFFFHHVNDIDIFLFEGNTTPHFVCEWGWVEDVLKIGIIILKTITITKSTSLVKPRYPFSSLLIICKQDCSTVLGLDSNKVRYHSLSHSPLNKFYENILK